MQLPRDPRFDAEAAGFGLRFTCEDCGFFDRAADACAHEWPTALHRGARYRRPLAAGGARELVFCKEFELR